MASSLVECPSCSLPYDGNVRRPLILTDCGHTICAECTSKLQKTPESEIVFVECPVCQTVNVSFASKGFVTNLSILDVAGIKLSIPPPQPTVEEVMTISTPITNRGTYDLIEVVKSRIELMSGVRTCEIRANVTNSGTMIMPMLFDPKDKLPAGSDIVCHFYGSVLNRGTIITNTHRGVVGVLHQSITNTGTILGQAVKGAALKKIRTAPRTFVVKSGSTTSVFSGGFTNMPGSFMTTGGTQTFHFGPSFPLGQPLQFHHGRNTIVLKSEDGDLIVKKES
ncbi:MAG: hypothetical protein BVN35_06030 [Proteobacteria bacterium ST_bin11]|nr:MAG: hypothetical protein BVN35_06030 [Proteobacteria bacterium ST_bin11]